MTDLHQNYIMFQTLK